MAVNSTFFFTNEQGKDIIVQDSLLDNEVMTQSTDLSNMFFDLKKLSEKEKKLDLHCITLSDYWRKDMIPRGLRIKKFPSFGSDNTDFKDKWEAILNKCSLDLILLLITEAKIQKNNVQEEIQELKQKIADIQDSAQTKESFEQKLRVDIEKLSQTLRQLKLDKFRRDQEDYKQGKVYTWTNKSSHQRDNHRPRRAHSVSFHLPSSGEDEGAASDSNTSTSDFLESRTDPTHFKRRGGRRAGRRGGGGGSGRFPPQDSDNHYQQRQVLRSSMKPLNKR